MTPHNLGPNVQQNHIPLIAEGSRQEGSPPPPLEPLASTKLGDMRRNPHCVLLIAIGVLQTSPIGGTNRQTRNIFK